MATTEKLVVDNKDPQKKKKLIEPGIIYLSRIPPLMNVKQVQLMFGKYGDIGRLFLQPNDKVSRGKRGRSFTEGWVEFLDKRIAKKVALALNNTQIGGKKRSKWYDEIWNIKYLHRFKWAHLNERLAYEKAVHNQRMRQEIAQAKREASFHMQNAELKRKRLKGKTETDEERKVDVRLKETDDEIRAKKTRKLDSDKSSPQKLKEEKVNKKSATGKNLLGIIFSGGGKSDEIS